jgi:hypothetical protein
LAVGDAGCGAEDIKPNHDDEVSGKSPYLGGVSVGRFWLIYSGILANLVTLPILAASRLLIRRIVHIVL